MNVSEIIAMINYHEGEIQKLKEMLPVGKTILTKERGEFVDEAADTVMWAYRAFDQKTLANIRNNVKYGYEFNFDGYGKHEWPVRYRLKHTVWDYIRMNAVSIATNGRTKRIYNHKTGQCLVSGEELEEIKRQIKLLTKQWCDSWAP